MRTEIRALHKTGYCVMAFLLFTLNAYAQDSLNLKPFERYWTKPRLVAKAGFGIQEAVFVEAGIQLHKIYVHPLSLASAGPYLTIDALLPDNQLILGPKAGYEITAGLIGLAADITYYTDFDMEAVVFTPRAGLSIMGFVNLFYGRNFPLSEFQFPQIDQNRFSLVFNLNRDYFNLREAPAKAGKK
jgi:hypothetical protein